ncbi:MAG TPA: hypothetical protein VEZ24_08930 [Microvirga sp.]|nr:hypothetical protein [Microvirga sp.]
MNRIFSTALASALTLAFAGSFPAAAETKTRKEPTAAQLAARERMTKCSAEWKTAKAGGKVEPGMKWPKFWSACNTRLKGGTKA